ncbi:hypothetical protein E2C01_090086 [Portunus trituberculatus]|uniref:Secreted protein n=1 Tax=Portunus trituberculatus TaxID=210409 RepID=A0A5B7JKZ1_PORTR|nr:hypothetical protein [Portunus trituberculatus]
MHMFLLPLTFFLSSPPFVEAPQCTSRRRAAVRFSAPRSPEGWWDLPLLSPRKVRNGLQFRKSAHTRPLRWKFLREGCDVRGFVGALNDVVRGA